jgi:hypothetical protein
MAAKYKPGYGHRWPDRFRSHSGVEIALTRTERTYFLDRAAARDLAAFMRENKGTELRRETGAKLRRDLTRIGSQRLVPLKSAHASPPVGKLGYLIAGSTVTYIERSLAALQSSCQTRVAT